jgi:uncharacterized protein (UPF0276 family)
MATPGLFPYLGCGLGLRPRYYSEILERKPASISWFEAVTENYLPYPGVGAGRAIGFLERIRRDYPVVLHGVSLSLGSTDPLDRGYLKAWKKLIDRIDPAWVSDHLCWTGVQGRNFHDLLPLPYNQATVRHVAARISRVQDYLGRRMLIENVSSYVEFAGAEMTEGEFVAEVARRADCGILLDVNNIYVSHRNHGTDPARYLAAIPRERIGQLHLAGHSDHGDHLIDTHEQPVPEAVWELYEQTIALFGPLTAMVERDGNYPELSELEAEVERARAVQARQWRVSEHASDPRPATAL